MNNSLTKALIYYTSTTKIMHTKSFFFYSLGLRIFLTELFFVKHKAPFFKTKLYHLLSAPHPLCFLLHFSKHPSTFKKKKTHHK